MGSLLFILFLAGFIYLVIFHKPQNVSDDQITHWFSSKLSEISSNLEKDIDSDKKGEYRHAGKQTFEKVGAITYLLRDKNFNRFDVSQISMVTASDVRATEGYKQLEKKALGLGVSIQLVEREVEGDGVESFDEMDEYIDDYPRFYSVIVEGW